MTAFTNISLSLTPSFGEASWAHNYSVNKARYHFIKPKARFYQHEKCNPSSKSKVIHFSNYIASSLYEVLFSLKTFTFLFTACLINRYKYVVYTSASSTIILLTCLASHLPCPVAEVRMYKILMRRKEGGWGEDLGLWGGRGVTRFSKKCFLSVLQKFTVTCTINPYICK